MKTLIADVTAYQNAAPMPVLARPDLAIAALLAEPPADLALLAEMLSLPSATRIGDEFEAIDVAAVDRRVAASNASSPPVSRA